MKRLLLAFAPNALLRKALQRNPQGLDSHCFCGDHLFRQGHCAEARAALQKARQAPSRPSRERADPGWRGEIDALLKTIHDKQD